MNERQDAHPPHRTHHPHAFTNLPAIPSRRAKRREGKERKQLV